MLEKMDKEDVFINSSQFVVNKIKESQNDSNRPESMQIPHYEVCKLMKELEYKYKKV